MSSIQTTLDLGRMVKQKHPEYADLDDQEVGRKVQSKFPGAYDDFVDAPDALGPLGAKNASLADKAMSNGLPPAPDLSPSIASNVTDDFSQGNIAHGLHTAAKGAGDSLLPLGIGALVLNPAATLGGLAVGAGGAGLAHIGAGLAGASPDWQDVAGDAGGMAGGLAGAHLGDMLGGLAAQHGPSILDRRFLGALLKETPILKGYFGKPMQILHELTKERMAQSQPTPQIDFSSLHTNPAEVFAASRPPAPEPIQFPPHTNPQEVFSGSQPSPVSFDFTNPQDVFASLPKAAPSAPAQPSMEFPPFTPADQMNDMFAAVRRANPEAVKVSHEAPPLPGSAAQSNGNPLLPGHAQVLEHAAPKGVDEATRNKILNLTEHIKLQGMKGKDLEAMTPEARNALANEAITTGKSAGRTVPKKYGSGFDGATGDTLRFVIQSLKDQGLY